MKALIIEDEFHLADLVKERLQENQHEVEIAQNGVSGYLLASSDIYDYLLVDIMLPGMDGTEIVKKLRQEGITVPILLLTAKDSLEDRVYGLDCGADDYLTKPFEMEELLARTRALTRRKGSLMMQSDVFGNLRMDKANCGIENTESDQKVALSIREYELLEYLMSNRNQVLTREQISVKIWGYEYDGEYNNVDVYMSFLRKKLTFIDTNIRIKSVRGVGYKMESCRD